MEAPQLVGASQIVGAAVDIIDISHTLGAAVDIVDTSHTLGEAADSMDTSQLLGVSQMVGASPQPEDQGLKEQLQ